MKIRLVPSGYDGTCGHCGGRFRKGDPVGFLDDRVACQDCCEKEG